MRNTSHLTGEVTWHLTNASSAGSICSRPEEKNMCASQHRERHVWKMIHFDHRRRSTVSHDQCQENTLFLDSSGGSVEEMSRTYAVGVGVPGAAGLPGCTGATGAGAGVGGSFGSETRRSRSVEN